jgi:hypothetical protein
MNLISLADLPVTTPVAIAIGVAALVALYFAFKATKFLMKLLLLLAGLLVLGGAVWWYLASRGH